MVRKLVLALATVGAMHSGIANALGLGEIKLNSALNQPLNAEIELLQTRNLSENEILPNLASREDFGNAGVERVFFLTQMKFEIAEREGGGKYLKVTTKKAVREPYLNFLVEVHWPSGRLLREYTLLLDPPVFADTQTALAPVTAPVVPTKTVPVEQVAPVSMPKPAMEDPTPAKVDKTAAVKPEAEKEAAPQKVAPQTTQVSTKPVMTQPKMVDEAPRIYKTQRNDTLWEIAAKARPKNKASVQQTMVAIQRLNPEAFIDNNVNKLKTGKVLRLPEEQLITDITAREAIGVIAQQNRDWTEEREARFAQLDATRRTKTGSVVREAETSGRLRLAAPEQEGSATSAAGDTSKSGSNADVSKLESKLSMTLENLEKAKSENTELNSKLTDLEGQMDKLERLVALKSEQLAALQSKLSEEERLAAEAAAKAAEAKVEQEAAEAAKAQDAAVAKVAGSEEKPQQPDVTEAAPAPVPEKPVAEAKPLPKPATPTTEPKTEVGLVDEILGNPMYLAAAGGALILLLGGLFVVARGRHRDEQESLADFDDVSFDSEQDNVDLGAAASAGAESAEDAVSDEAAPGAESDPISAADIYVAYGRFSEAADRLKDAIAQEPERTDLRLKLMEVYSESQDLEGFEQQQAELGDADAATLARVEELRGKFATVTAEQAPEFTLDDLENELNESSVSADESPSLDDLELDLDAELESGVDSSTTTEEAGEFDLDLDLDEANDAAAEAEVSLDDLELELDSDLVEESTEEADFDFSLDEELAGDLDALDQGDDKEADKEESLELGADLEALENDLGEELTSEVDASEESLEELEASLDDVDLDLDLETASEQESEDDDFGSLMEGLEDINSDLQVEDEAAELDELADIETIDDLAEEEELSELASLEDSEDLSADLSSGLGESLTLDDSELTEVAESEEEAALNLDEDLDFDLGDLSEVEEAVAEESVDLEPSEELEQVTEAEELAEQEVEAGVAAEAETAAADLDLGESLDSELGDDFDFLAGTDEAATKLDLAKAYIDMGDTEGARDILDEVVTEGSDEQQSEAKELIDSIS